MTAGGVASVTTNHVEDFSTMVRPTGMFKPRDYYIYAALTVVLSLIFLSSLILFAARWLKKSSVPGREPKGSVQMSKLSNRESYHAFDP